MSRPSRNPFSRFFKRSDSSRSTPSSSNANVPTQTHLPAPSPRPSGPRTPPRTPSPPLHPPTPPTSVLATPAIPSPPPQFLQLPQRPMDYGMIASSTSYDARFPQNHLLSPSASSLNPYSSLPLVSRTPTPQLGEPTGFAGAHDFVLNNPQFNDISLGRPGIDKLLKHSMPDAFHNSAARYPPPKCHLGTRNDYITKVTDWASGNSDHYEPILWIRGPFGIGKSAIAQSCAEALQLQNKLAATLFFSRSNADRDDPLRVFTSIAYQIATLCEPFSEIINALICKDPALAKKSLSTQFDDLLVYPLSRVDTVTTRLEGRVVIIDGLDECSGSSEQCEIIKVIAGSARNRTTPFRWFITSRPEDPIIRTMKSPSVFPISFHLELPISRKVDHEILLYLTDEFNKIRESHGLPESWPSEATLALLVERTAGLWIYITTIVRFVAEEDSYGPEHQLRVVLQFAKDASNKVGVDNPLAAMDLLYTLIMRRVPEKIRKTVRSILLVQSVLDSNPRRTTAVLGLSEDQFRRSCASIQSVMELPGSNMEPMHLRFYHASFLDFMKDPERSNELCIYGDFLIEYRRELLGWLNHVCSRSTGPLDITFPSESALPEGLNRDLCYHWKLACFWELACVPNHPFDFGTAVSFELLKFRMMLQLSAAFNYAFFSRELQCLRSNLPPSLRDKVVRQDKCPTPGCTNTQPVWILGHGENETVAACDSDGDLRLQDNQGPGRGQCFCRFREDDSESSE